MFEIYSGPVFLALRYTLEAAERTMWEFRNRWPDAQWYCRAFKPDLNGECLNCDEWADAHQDPPRA